MTEDQNPKQYDLEDRTYALARDVRGFAKGSKRTIANVEDGRQLINASEIRRQEPIQESTELMSIIGSIARRSE